MVNLRKDLKMRIHRPANTVHSKIPSTTKEDSISKYQQHDEDNPAVITVPLHRQDWTERHTEELRNDRETLLKSPSDMLNKNTKRGTTTTTTTSIIPITNKHPTSRQAYIRRRNNNNDRSPSANQSQRMLQTYEIETVSDGTKGGVGVMFDVRARTEQSIRITSFQFQTRDFIENCRVRIFSKAGTHISHETSEDDWTLVVDSETECKGFGIDTEVSSDMFNPEQVEEGMVIEANGVRAFYIDVVTPVRYTVTDTLGSVFVQDNYVEILEGTGFSGFFSTYFSPRMWNGKLTYELVTEIPDTIELPDMGGMSNSSEVDMDIDSEIDIVDSEIDMVVDPVVIPDNSTETNIIEIEDDVSTDTPTETEEDEMIPSASNDHEIISTGEKCEYVNASITASFEDNTRSYGHMFNIFAKSKSDLIIKGLEFHTRLNENLFYEIYSIKDGFETAVNRIEEWALIASGDVMGAGHGAGTLVIGDDFTPTEVKAGRKQGFYVTMHAEELIYGPSMLNVHDFFEEDDQIALEVGLSVPNYPLGNDFYYPRQWNGKVFYQTVPSCRQTTNVNYNIALSYPEEWTEEEIMSTVDSKVESILKQLVSADPSLKESEILSVQATYESEMESFPCQSEESSRVCRGIRIDVLLDHPSENDYGQVTVDLLDYNNQISDTLDIMPLEVVKYTGDEGLKSDITIVIAGLPSRDMGEKERLYFEETITSFLKRKATKGVEVMTVKVNEINFRQTTKTNRHSTRKTLIMERGGRKLQSVSYEADIETAITGKHRPPPDINFDDFVEDSINTSSEELREELQTNSGDEGGLYFEDMEEIFAQAPRRNEPTISPQIVNTESTSGILTPTMIPQLPTSPPKKILESSKSGLGLGVTIGIVVGVAMVTFIAVFGAFVMRKRLRDKKRLDSNGSQKDICDDDDDPIFFDLFQGKQEPNNLNTGARVGQGINYKDDRNDQAYTTEDTQSSSSSAVQQQHHDRGPSSSRTRRGSFRKSRHGDSSCVDYMEVGSQEEGDAGDVGGRRPASKSMIRSTAEYGDDSTVGSHSSNHSNRSRGHHKRLSCDHLEFKAANGFDPPPRRMKSKRYSIADMENDYEGKVRQKYYEGSLRDSYSRTRHHKSAVMRRAGHPALNNDGRRSSVPGSVSSKTSHSYQNQRREREKLRPSSISWIHRSESEEAGDEAEPSNGQEYRSNSQIHHSNEDCSIATTSTNSTISTKGKIPGRTSQL